MGMTGVSINQSVLSAEGLWILAKGNGDIVIKIMIYRVLELTCQYLSITLKTESLG